MASLSSSVHQPYVHHQIFTSALPRRPAAENFVALAVHGCPLFGGSTSTICKNFRGFKLWIHRKVNLPRPKIKQKQERKNEFKMQHIEDKDQLEGYSEPHFPREDIQQFSASVVSNEYVSSSNAHDGKNSIPNQLQMARSMKTLTRSSQSTPTFLSIAVIGATGELARMKIFPALFSLYYSGFLPENVAIFGYSRKNLTDDNLRSMIASTLTCRIDQQQDCNDKMEAFLKRMYHINAGYNNKEGMLKLSALMEEVEGESKGNRIFYLSVPEEALLDVAFSLANSAQSNKGWNRIIIEKPFGFDIQSSDQLAQSLLKKFDENQIYRIDHLLGRNTIENLAVLRFSNLVFMPLWNRNYIRNVQVILSEDFSSKTPDRYLNSHGIIGDVVHSHIFQTIALLAMEPPVSLDGEDVRNEKVKLLRSIRKLDTSNVILGYCTPAAGAKVVSDVGLKAPTYFATAMFIDNARWDGVPFMIKVGRGLTNHRVEIRIQFRHVPGNLYSGHVGQRPNLANNELILRDVPDEAILVRVNNKIPGLGIHLDASELNLLYKDKYNIVVPDSYEQLLHDVIDGDNHLFMRSDEVATAWNVLSPVLHEMDRKNLVSERYEQGSRGPEKAIYLWAKHGVKWMDD